MPFSSTEWLLSSLCAMSIVVESRKKEERPDSQTPSNAIRIRAGDLRGFRSDWFETSSDVLYRPHFDASCGALARKQEANWKYFAILDIYSSRDSFVDRGDEQRNRSTEQEKCRKEEEKRQPESCNSSK